MKALLIKEARLSTPLLTYCFLVFSLLTFCPGYPILIGSFFTCLGIFQAYQLMVTNHDLLFSLLLPVGKKEVIKAKFIFASLMEMVAFLLMAIITIIRMVFLNQSLVYRENQLMAANYVFLAFTLLIFAEFNWYFLRGFFKTGYYLSKPFIYFSLAAFVTIALGETLHHLPGLAFLNLSRGPMGIQLTCFGLSILVYLLITFLAHQRAAISFEKLNL